MAIYNLEKAERETIISIDETTDMWEVYTTQVGMMKKLDRFCEENPKEWTCVNVRYFDSIDKQVISKTYRCKKNLVSLRPKTVKRELTDEQRERIRMMGKANAKNKPEFTE